MEADGSELSSKCGVARSYNRASEAFPPNNQVFDSSLFTCALNWSSSDSPSCAQKDPDMKPPRACRQCRESKRKCTRARPGEPCRSCQQRELRCDAPLANGTLTESPVSEELPTTIAADKRYDHELVSDLPQEIIAQLVECYLDKVHDRAHSIFHPSTLRAQLKHGVLAKPVVYSMCAIGSKVSPDPNLRNLEAPLTAQAKRLLQAQLACVCLENIQACILVSVLMAGSCEPNLEALFVRKDTFFRLSLSCSLFYFSFSFPPCPCT